MVKKFAITCTFGGGQASKVDFYIGKPSVDKHPIEFQVKWLADNKGGQISPEMMDSIAKIRNLADNNNVSFEELCFYAINVANDEVKEEIPEFNRLLATLD
ncbi:MAG: DUF2610 domain-containing protein [Rickettsiales bacterium]|jgi:hypothetical protein|nr:DUF2610 domain-containing protein [Rickettsiales bacterium]